MKACREMKLDQRDYMELMKFDGRDIWPIQIGGCWQCGTENEKSWPTIWPEQEDITDLAIRYVIEKLNFTNQYKYVCLWWDENGSTLHSRLFNLFHDEVITELQKNGFAIERVENNRIKVSWK